jgi:hypothetical protein
MLLKVSVQITPKTDRRGFVDVWQLREAVSAVEALTAYKPHSIKVVAGPSSQEFLQQRAKLLAEIESTIDAYLAREPRWAVFLLQRVGHHEWAPEGTHSKTSKINNAWLGDWALTEVFNGKRINWIRLNESINNTRARVTRKEGSTFMSFESENSPSSPIADASDCQLRYSGGLTYLPAENMQAAMSRETVLGYLATYAVEGLQDTLKPFHPKKRYKQVLVHCPEGESLDSQRARYLLLARDTMIELASDNRAIEYICHFKRVNGLRCQGGVDLSFSNSVMSIELIGLLNR